MHVCVCVFSCGCARVFFFFVVFFCSPVLCICPLMKNVFVCVSLCLFITSVYRQRIPSHRQPDRCCSSYCCAAPLGRTLLAFSPLIDKHNYNILHDYTVSPSHTRTSFVPNNSYSHSQRGRLGNEEAGGGKKGMSRKRKWSEVIKNRCIY